MSEQELIAQLRREVRARDKAIGVLADALDEADSIIAINCGIETPKSWDRAMQRCQKARAALKVQSTREQEGK